MHILTSNEVLVAAMGQRHPCIGPALLLVSMVEGKVKACIQPWKYQPSHVTLRPPLLHCFWKPSIIRFILYTSELLGKTFGAF